LILGCTGSVAVTLLAYDLLRAPLGLGVAIAVGLVAFLLITTPFVWSDPVRPRLTRWMVREFKQVEAAEAVGPA
jgi:hypothetical protein